MKRKTPAIPIRCVDFSDSSQVVSLFTRESGLVEGIAKGAHREKNPFQGPFDLAVLYEAVFIEKRSAGLAILCEASVLEGFRGLRSGWARHIAGSHLLEFLRAATVANEPEPALFDLTVETLGGIAAADATRVAPLLARFDTAALLILGLLAPLDSCVECGRLRPRSHGPVFLSPIAKGILCRACRAGHAHLGGFTLPGPAVELLDGFARLESPVEWDAVDERWMSFGRPARRAISELRTNLLERELVLLKSSNSWL